MTSPLFAADAWLDKPFEFAELDEKIRETLARYEAARAGRAASTPSSRRREPAPRRRPRRRRPRRRRPRRRPPPKKAPAKKAAREEGAREEGRREEGAREEGRVAKKAPAKKAARARRRPRRRPREEGGREEGRAAKTGGREERRESLEVIASTVVHAIARAGMISRPSRRKVRADAGVARRRNFRASPPSAATMHAARPPRGAEVRRDSRPREPQSEPDPVSESRQTELGQIRRAAAVVRASDARLAGAPVFCRAR